MIFVYKHETGTAISKTFCSFDFHPDLPHKGAGNEKRMFLFCFVFFVYLFCRAQTTLHCRPHDPADAGATGGPASIWSGGTLGCVARRIVLPPLPSSLLSSVQLFPSPGRATFQRLSVRSLIISSPVLPPVHVVV